MSSEVRPGRPPLDEPPGVGRNMHLLRPGVGFLHVGIAVLRSIPRNTVGGGPGCNLILDGGDGVLPWVSPLRGRERLDQDGSIGESEWTCGGGRAFLPGREAFPALCV